jgi:hypothetical protein
VMLIAVFEQVCGQVVSRQDRINIEDLWHPGLMSVSAVTQIYTGDCAQEIANLYNALAEELCVRRTRMQQEIASQNEIDHIMKHEITRLGEDMATKVEIARITAQEEIESLACGVVYEILDIIFSQVEQSVEKSHDVMVRVKTPNEQAWDALKAKRENAKRAASAHAAMLQAHSKAKADKLRAKHERAVCKEIASSIIEEIVTSVPSTSFEVDGYVEDLVLCVMAEACDVACAVGDIDEYGLQGEAQNDTPPRVKRRRAPGRKKPDSAWRQRKLQDFFVFMTPRTTTHLANESAWRRMPRRLYRRRLYDFVHARMKRSARKHLTITRFPAVNWDASSGDDPPSWDCAGALNKEEEATEWRSLQPTEVARPRKRARLNDSALITVSKCNSSEGAQKERTEPGELHRRVHRVMVRSYWFAPHIFSSYMSLSSVITRHLQFDAEKQEYTNMPASEAIEFLASYNVRISEVVPGLVLILYDTGCTVFLSPLSDHFCVEIQCDAAINGIGKRSVKICGPIAISFLDAKAQNYVTYESPRGFFMGDLNFGIFPSGQAERIGWEFHVRELNPYFIADGLHVPLIKDYQTGLTWMAERKLAKPTVVAKRRFVEKFAKDPSARVFHDRIGSPEICPNAPDTKENIDKYITASGSSCFGQYHCTPRPTVVRGGSQRVAKAKDVMVGTRSQSAKKNGAQSHGKQDRDAESDIVLHDQSKSDVGKNEKPESLEQNAKGDEDQEAGNKDLQLVTENGFQDLDMQVAKPYTKSDEEMLTKAKIIAASKMKPRYVKVPGTRFFNLGEAEETAAWNRYFHQLAVHLEPGTAWEGVKLADGAEVMKGLELLRRVEGKHVTTCACDECLRYKSKLSPIPDRRTDRPRRVDRVKKLYLDPSGKLSTPSIYHNYQYYMMGVTDEGYMIVHGMTFRDQALFVIGRMFDSLGGAPLAVQVDPAGELNSKIAESYFTHRETRVDVTQSSEHWRNGRPERRHSLVKGCTRCTLAHANAPLEFWFLCLSHVVFTLNLLLRSRDNDTKEIKEMTVWEAHFGRKPNLNHYLIGPWGCLAYIVLTKEQRDKKGIDKSWGPRALAGIYVGCVMNHKEGAYEFLVHDGMRIRSTTANLRIVGDCFPFKYQQRRDLDLVINPQVEELEDDDVDLIANVGSVDEEQEHHSALSCRGVEDLFEEASQEHVRELKRLFVFVGSENAEAKANLERRVQRSKGKGRALLKSKQKVHNALARNSVAASRNPDEYLVEVTESGEQVVMLDPRDFHLPAAPADFKFELPYEGAKYKIAEPVDFSTKREMSVTAKNPHDRYIGRKVRKAFRIRRKVRGKALTVWQPFGGVVRAYDAKRAVFDILYEDNDEEEVDFLELGDILIMGKEFGDKDEHQGRTRAEVIAEMGEEALIAAMAEEVLDAHGKTFYGEDRPNKRVTFEDSMHPCAHVGTNKSFSPLTCDCKKCLSESTTCSATSGERSWEARVKEEQAFKKWEYGESGERKCGWIADEAGEKELGFVHCTARCQCRSCQYCYVCQGDEVKWSEDKLRKCMEGEKLGQGELQHTKTQLERMLRHGKLEKANARFLAATAAVAPGEEAQGLEDSVSPPAYKEMETKIDDAPRNAKELHAHDEYEAIVKSGKLEIKQLLDMGVFVLPSDQEMKEIRDHNKRVLRCKMVYARKYESVVGDDGQIRDRFLKWKGRLAAVGTSEVKSLDTCWSTFSPTIGMTAMRTLIALMCRKGFDVRSYDLSGAFLGTDLAREVYVKLPEEAGIYAGKIVRCVKALYGLITSSRDFVKSLSERILSFEDNGGKFKKMDTDHCIYVFTDRDGNEMILSHYVDDIICGSNNQELRARLFQHLNKQWKITDEGVLTRFVGLNFERSDDGLTWEASCGPYIDKIAKRFKIDPKIQETPMDAGFAVMPEDLREEHSAEEMAAMETEFRSMIGSLAFASVTIRWDIAYSVSVLSRYLMKPNRKVIAAARRVIQYLMTMRDMKIRWTAEEDKVPADKRNKLWGAADASYASDAITRRSHGGYLLFLNGGCISWKSGLQKMVTLSSCESEFVALCSAILEVRYLRQFLNELGHKQEEPTLLWEDNKAAIIIAEGETSSAGRSKHIDVRFKHVAQSIREGVARVRYVSTKWNYADIMTKPLTKLEFKRLRDLCLRPESGITGYPSMEQENISLDEEVANFFFEESWLG